jgi:hypothetical protein
VLLLLNWEPPAPESGGPASLGADVTVEALARFEPAIVADEQFYLYRVHSRSD